MTRYLARVVGTAHPDHANALLVIGRILQAQGRPRAGLPYLERAAAALAWIRVEDQAVGELAAQALLTRAHCLQELGQFDEGRAHARGALRVARRVDADAALVASIHNQLGMRGKFSGGAGPGLIRGRRRSGLGLQGAGPG